MIPRPGKRWLRRSSQPKPIEKRPGRHLDEGVGIPDGAGANARDNNTLYLEAWIVF